LTSISGATASPLSRSLNAGIALVIAYFFTGCATFVNGTRQPIVIEARSAADSQAIEAKCDLHNNKGSWQMNAPGTVEVTRSPDDLHVRCEDKDSTPGTAALTSRANAGFWGNALLTCGIGMPVDYFSGAGFDYPTPITILIGSASHSKGNSDSASSAPDSP